MMINNDELVHLSALVQKAEETRNLQDTTALQQYVTNTPGLAVQTFHLTGEVKEKLIYYARFAHFEIAFQELEV